MGPGAGKGVASWSSFDGGHVVDVLEEMIDSGSESLRTWEFVCPEMGIVDNLGDLGVKFLEFEECSVNEMAMGSDEPSSEPKVFGKTLRRFCLRRVRPSALGPISGMDVEGMEDVKSCCWVLICVE